jgi:LysM repeat protein
MDWKTDSDLNELDNEPYSSFQSNKSGKLFDRLELPIILIGAGLLALVILFVLFIPKKNEITIDDYKHLVSRLDQLEDKLDTIAGKEIDLEEFDPSKNPVQYQQVINWIKSNAEVISETIKKVEEIEKKIQDVPGSKTAVHSSPVNVKNKSSEKNALVLKPTTVPAAKTKAIEKPVKPIKVTETRPIEKSTPVQIKPRKETKPETKPVIVEKPEQKPTDILPVAAAPETTVNPKPIPEAKPLPAKPETYKYIFHRVEKGETLYRISVNYGISVQELQKLNDRKADDLIIDIGEELIVKKEKQ